MIWKLWSTADSIFFVKKYCFCHYGKFNFFIWHLQLCNFICIPLCYYCFRYLGQIPSVKASCPIRPFTEINGNILNKDCYYRYDVVTSVTSPMHTSLFLSLWVCHDSLFFFPSNKQLHWPKHSHPCPNADSASTAASLLLASAGSQLYN